MTYFSVKHPDCRRLLRICHAYRLLFFFYVSGNISESVARKARKFARGYRSRLYLYRGQEPIHEHVRFANLAAV